MVYSKVVSCAIWGTAADIRQQNPWRFCAVTDIRIFFYRQLISKHNLKENVFYYLAFDRFVNVLLLRKEHGGFLCRAVMGEKILSLSYSSHPQCM